MSNVLPCLLKTSYCQFDLQQANIKILKILIIQSNKIIVKPVIAEEAVLCWARCRLNDLKTISVSAKYMTRLHWTFENKYLNVASKLLPCNFYLKHQYIAQFRKKYLKFGYQNINNKKFKNISVVLCNHTNALLIILYPKGTFSKKIRHYNMYNIDFSL